MGITFIFDVSGLIEDLTIINHYSIEGPSISLVYLTDSLMFQNISIQNANSDIYNMKIFNLWRAQSNIRNFSIKNISVSSIFEMVFTSWMIIQNISLIMVNGINNKVGSGLILVDSSSTLFIYDLLVQEIYSNTPIISLFDSSLTIFSAMIFRVFISNNSREYLITSESSNITFKKVQINIYNRSILLGTAANLKFDDFTCVNEGKFYAGDAFYSYSAIELVRTNQASISNSLFVNSSLGGYGGVNFNIKRKKNLLNFKDLLFLHK